MNNPATRVRQFVENTSILKLSEIYQSSDYLRLFVKDLKTLLICCESQYAGDTPLIARLRQMRSDWYASGGEDGSATIPGGMIGEIIMALTDPGPLKEAYDAGKSFGFTSVAQYEAKAIVRFVQEECAKIAEEDNTPAYGPNRADMEALASIQRANIARAIRVAVLPAALARSDSARVDHVPDARKMIPAGMVPWHGGDSAPADWDSGPVISRQGHVIYGMAGQYPGRWMHLRSRDDIIAYTPKPNASGGGEREELIATLKAAGGIHNPDFNAPFIADALLRRFPTLAQPATREDEAVHRKLLGEVDQAIAIVAARAIRSAFFTSVSGEKPHRYHLSLAYPTMEAMHAAEDAIKRWAKMVLEPGA